MERGRADERGKEGRGEMEGIEEGGVEGEYSSQRQCNIEGEKGGYGYMQGRKSIEGMKQQHG